MSCRHDLANGTCTRCYPSNPYGRSDRDRVDPGPEENFSPNLDGPGAVSAVPADLSGLAKEVGFKIVAWDGDHGAISGHGMSYVGTHAELRAFASAWRDCASFILAESQKSAPRSSDIVHRVLSLRSYYQIENNEVFRVVARPQITPFRGTRLAIPDEIADRFEIVDLLVGCRSQTPSADPVSATLYAARLRDRALLYCDPGLVSVRVSIAVDAVAEFGRAVSFDACQAGMEVTVAARLLPGSPPTEFEAIVLGLGVEHDGDRSLAERRAVLRGLSPLRGRSAAEALMPEGVPGRYTSNVDDHDEG